MNVAAVQNPLTSFVDDVDATRRAIALQDRPTLLVADSCGGMVITEAGTDPKVKSLVYIAARAPDAGEEPVISTLEKIAQSGQISFGIRDRSPPSGCTNGEGAVGHVIDACMHVVAAVRRELGRTDLRVAMRPALSGSR
ncbi:hypothetical protein [Variovorax sp. E3]|uniref:hypothetical protein n=1 Tax=Variovorax sp. E3 TaxID=1914993 RepID=UPI0027DD5959|nr:hypothetical protein [Variovorax sp. E3]